MYHEPDYGLKLTDKGLYTPTELSALQKDTEAQIRQEPDVITARAILSELTCGVVLVTLKVKDRFGIAEIEGTIGGE